MVDVVQVSKGDATDLVRSVGGLLFATGAIVLFARKSTHHNWSDLALLLVVLIPAVVLYIVAFGGLERSRDDGPRPWQAVLMVAAILLWPIALLQFLELVGASTHHRLYIAAVFVFTGVLAAYAARRARVRYAALLAGLSFLVAWLYIWAKILNHPSVNTGRWLILGAGALLLVVAIALARARAIGASEIATAGGIATVAAGVLGVIVGTFVAATRSLFAVTESSSVTSTGERPVRVEEISEGASHAVRRHVGLYHGPPSHPIVAHGSLPLSRLSHSRASVSPSLVHLAHTSGVQHLGWDVYLLVVSVALIWAAARWGVRGLGYVGAVGLLAFILSVAAQITRLEAGHTPTGSVVGWPLVLIVAGAVGLVVPALDRRRKDT